MELSFHSETIHDEFAKIAARECREPSISDAQLFAEDHLKNVAEPCDDYKMPRALHAMERSQHRRDFGDVVQVEQRDVQEWL
jgi:hypothetical protein